MPIYEYQCMDCGQKFEQIRSMKDADAPIKCEQCQGLKTKRLLSVCYTHGNEKSMGTNSSSCASCRGGTCSSCGQR